MSILKVNIVGDSSKLKKSLKTASQSLQTFGEKAKSLGASLSTRLTLPLGIAGGAAIKMASDLEESLNKVDVAFKSSSGEVREFGKTTLESFGIAQGTALDMAAMFGDMSTSMGLTTSEAANMSTSLVGLAGDLASFKNINIEEVTTALAGVFTGETESLKRLGVVMTETNLKQFALSQGIQKNIKDFTQSEKVQLRFQYVMQKTSNAHGDFARTSGGAANQMRIFQESLKELGASIGAVILPAFTKIVKHANNILKAFKNLDPTTKTLIVIFGGVAAALPPLIFAIGSLTTAFAALNVTTGGIIIVLGALAAGLAAVAKHQMLKNTIKDLNKELIENKRAVNEAAAAQDGSKEASLKLFKAKQKLLKVELDLLKANQDRAQGAIARVLGIESEEYKKLGEKIAETEQKIKNYDLSIKGLEGSLKDTGDQAKNTKNDLAAVTELPLDLKIKFELEEEAKNFVDTFNNEVGKQIDNIDSTAVNFGSVFSDQIEEAFDPNSVAVMDEFFDGVEENLLKFTENTRQKMAIAQQQTEMLANTVGGVLMNSFTALAEGDDFFTTLISGLKKLAIQIGAAAAAALALNVLLPFLGGSGALAQGGQAGFKALFGSLSGIPGLANGGIVSAPTLAMVGDNTGAGRGNPEVIAPLNKLQGMMGNNNVNVGGEFKIQGQDLVVALQRAERNRSRIL